MRSPLPAARFIAALLTLPLGGCYLLKQGSVIVEHQNRAQEVDQMLASPDTSAELRRFLLLVGEIKRFAVREIGLKEDRNYTRYVELEHDYLVDVVSASKRDRFEAYLWHYPFFGAFPYKGFFRKEDALTEAERLKKLDLDVLVRKVDAFSTLGFFTDPLYSFMKDYPVFELADLIIHEQTHTTLYLKNEAQFNEELASFVGVEGALAFIRRKFGGDSAEYRDALDRLADLKRYRLLMLGLHRELSRLYAGPGSREEKLAQREGIFSDFWKAYQEEHAARFRTESFRSLKPFRLNNAYVLTFVQYSENLDRFYELYRLLGGDLGRTFTEIRAVEKRRGRKEPQEFLEELIERYTAADP